METKSLLFLILVLLLGLCSCSDYTNIPENSNTILDENPEIGSHRIPTRVIPVPTSDISPQLQALISQPLNPIFNAIPRNEEEWKILVEKVSNAVLASLPKLEERLCVEYNSITINGVHAFIVTPKNLTKEKEEFLLIHLHGGAYVFNPGKSGLPEAFMLASIGGYKVISIDYRMPPDHPYPAALDDVMTIWVALLKTHDPNKMGIFGTSAGGGLTLAMILRAKDKNLPLPAAIAPNTPWTDLNQIGDSYFINEWIDNILVSWNGILGRAAKLYANGHNMKDPYLSPIYGNFSGFPPTILTSGTRDLFLSNVVRAHRKLRRSGVEADLNVYHGFTHGHAVSIPTALSPLRCSGKLQTSSKSTLADN